MKAGVIVKCVSSYILLYMIPTEAEYEIYYLARLSSFLLHPYTVFSIIASLANKNYKLLQG